MNQNIKDMHKMRKVTIFRATSRELLLGYKLAAFHESDIQRPLRRDKDASGDYTLVVYEQIYAYNIHGHDEYSSVRLVSGTDGRKEVVPISRELFRTMISDIHAELGPDTLESLDLPVGTTKRLQSLGITGICHLLEHTYREVNKFPGIGVRNMAGIVEALAAKNLRLNPYN